MAYEGGYTSAVNAGQNREAQQVAIQQALQHMAQQQWLQQQAIQKQQDDQKYGMKALDTLSTMTPGPQSPPPGQASAPMMQPPPQVPPAAPPQAMAPGMGGGAASMFAPPPGGSAPPAQPMPQPAAPPQPQGWKASPAASPALGGPGAPPSAASAIAPGAAPPGGPPMGGGAQLPPGMPPTPGSAPGAQQGGVLPPEMLSAPKLIAELDKKGIPKDQQWEVFQRAWPIAEKQNQMAIQVLKEQAELQKVATAAVQQRRMELQAENTSRHQQVLEQQGQQRADTADRRADATERHLSRIGTGGAGGGGGLGTDAVDLAAAQYLKTGQLPPMYRDQAGRAKIINRAAEMQKEGGGAASDVAADRASFKADTGSLNFQQKRVDAIEGSMKKISKDMATLETVLDKGAFTDAKVVNVPVNKLRRAMSDPDLAKLDLAAQLVGVEYERLMTGGMMSVAQLHEGAREDAAKLISGDMAPKEIRAKVPIMRREMQNAKEAAHEQLGEIKSRMKGGKTAPAETSPYVETRKTADGRTLGKKADGTIEEVKQ